MYDIIWNGIVVGSAIILKEGLYYCIRCSCHLPKTGIHKVNIINGNQTYDLGICVPDGNGFSCVARIPCKRLCGTEFKFTISDRVNVKAIPIEIGKPFAYLDQLSTARLQYANGQPEIVIDSIPDQQDSGPNPVCQHK